MLAQPTTYEHIPRQPGPSQPITNQASQFSLIAPAQPALAQPCQTSVCKPSSCGPTRARLACPSPARTIPAQPNSCIHMLRNW